MEWTARAVGVFYILAGLLVIHAVRQNLFLDKAIAQITLKKPPLNERVQSGYMIAVAALTLGSGVTLLLLSRWAAAAFVLNSALQAGYLLWIRVRPPEDALEAQGRRQGLNAFVLYLVATAFVLGLFRGGVLT